MLNVFLRKMKSFLLYGTPFGEVYTKICDLMHHLKYGFKERNLKNDKAHLKYYLTKHYHIVEKGLALPEPRLGFGQPKILNVISKASQYESLYGADGLIVSIRKTFSDYLKFNEENSFDLPSSFELAVTEFISEGSHDGNGGLKHIQKEFSSTLDLQEFRDFAQGRVSVRDFSSETISAETIRDIVDIAKSAPSVCNRQGWKAHCYSDKLKIKELLSYQNGNAGFTDVIDKLLIVTADAKAFTNYESNQIFIDGGLFSMNILLAIHAAGLGACPLNTCYPYFIEKKVKLASEIPDNERLIMMIGIGSLKENYTAAYSPRNPTDEIYVAH